jgi:hypothetical protein
MTWPSISCGRRADAAAEFLAGHPEERSPGHRPADGTDSYVLGEINVSSVFPIPDEVSAEIARRVADAAVEASE